MPLAADGTAAPERLCAPCRSQPPPVHRTVAAFLYAPPLDRWLPRLKFHRDLTAGRLLSQLMLDRLYTAERPDAVLPVPLHRARLRSRGYDQALELARPLARALDLPLQCDLLQRIRATKPQSELDGAARSRNLRGAFAFGATVPPAHVALVDDVMTTGATLGELSKLLSEAGAADVQVWVFARTPA